MKLMVVARAIDQMAGGVERSSIRLMNNMVERGMEVEFLSWDVDKATSYFSMHPKVVWHRLNMGHPNEKASFMLKIKRAGVIRKLVRERNIDVVVCFQAGPFLAIRAYLLGIGIPVIVSERNSPLRFEHLKANKYKSIYFQSFRFAKKLIVQCENYCSYYPDYLQSRIITIPNPVYLAQLHTKNSVNVNTRYQLLSVGRLNYQKNYFVLIKAFSMIANEFPEWNLAIVGEGEDKVMLQQLIFKNKISKRITLHAATKNINEWYKESDVFCLPSRWEGFPNALAEALAHGLPAIGFSDCSGVNNLIEAGKNGLLAKGNNNPSSLAEELKKLMNDKELRLAMGHEAVDSMKKYNPENIYDMWEKLLAKTVNNEK